MKLKTGSRSSTTRNTLDEMKKTLNTCRILVTPTSFGRHNPALRQLLEEQVGEVIYNESGKPLPSEEVRKMLPGIGGYIAGLDWINADALAAADHLRVIARYGVGVDRVDLDAASAKGIVVTNTPGANARSVAELAIGFMLCLARMIPSADQAVRSGNWPRLDGISLYEKTIGIIGFGAIGQMVAELLHPFKARLLAADPYADSKRAGELGVEIVPLQQLQEESDMVTIHVPLLPDTEHLVDEAFMRGMKKGAALINTSRGGIINEDDLCKMLEEGHLRGAALDAYREEPPALDHALFSLPQVILTPHTGAHTDDATNQMGLIAVEECLRVLKGETPLYRVN